MINRAAVNAVVKMLQSKTVANKDGKRVLGLVKSGSGPSIGIPADTIVVDIAVISTWRNRRDGWSKRYLMKLEVLGWDMTFQMFLGWPTRGVE